MNITRKLIAAALVTATVVGGANSIAGASRSNREADIKVWVPRQGDVAGVDRWRPIAAWRCPTGRR